jgi:hypothetical protein
MCYEYASAVCYEYASAVCYEYASAVCCSLWLPGGNVAAYIRTLLPKQHYLYR